MRGTRREGQAEHDAGWNRTWDALNNSSGTNADLLAGHNGDIKLMAKTGVVAIKNMGPTQGSESIKEAVVDFAADQVKGAVIDAAVSSAGKNSVQQTAEGQTQNSQAPGLWQQVVSLFSPPPPPPPPGPVAPSPSQSGSTEEP